MRTRRPERREPHMKRRQGRGARPGAALAAVALLLACAGVTGWAGLRAGAAWNFLAAETLTERMYEAREFTPGGLEAAAERVRRASGAFPGRPDFLDLSGRLKQLQAVQPGAVGRPGRELLQAAAADHRTALAARPLWPYSWANLLAVKDRLGEVDAEFALALERSVETGPWEPAVQRQVIRSGVRWWDELQRAQRQQLRRVVDNALRTQPRHVFEIVRFYARPDLLCGPATGQPQIERWCREVSL